MTMPEKCITSDRIQALSKDINALDYMECSNLWGYEESVQLVLRKLADTAEASATLQNGQIKSAL